MKNNISYDTALSAAINMFGSATNEKRVLRLTAVMQEIGLPFPVFDKLVLQTNKKRINNPYLGFLVDEGCTFYICSYDRRDKQLYDAEGATIVTSKLVDLEPKIEEFDFNRHSTIPMVKESELNDYLYLAMNEWVKGLSPEQLGSFITAFAAKPDKVEVDTDGDFVVKVLSSNNNGVMFNYTKREIVARQEHKLRKKIAVGDHNVTTDALMLQLTLIAMKDPSKMNEVLNDISNAIQRDPKYGVHALEDYDEDADPSMVMMNRSVLGISFKRSGIVFPWNKLSSYKIDIDTIDRFQADGKAYITDKNYMKDIGDEFAANTAGVGRNSEYEVLIDGERYVIDVMLNNNRSDKLPKLLNGPNQFYRFLKAKVEGWNNMTWGNVLPDGTIMRQGGITLRTAVVETALNPGSGPSFIRPGLNFKVSVPKSLSQGTVNFLSLPKEVRDKLNALGSVSSTEEKPGLNYLRNLIEEKCKAVVDACNNGKLYGPGEVVLSFGTELGMNERIVVINREMNQHFRIKSYQLTEDLAGKGDYKADYFKVKFEADMVFEDPMVKMRNAYIKLTTLPYEVKWFDADHNLIPNWGGIDIALNPETTKSPSIFQAMFIQEMGGGYYNANSGRVYLNNWEKAIPHFTDEEVIRYQSVGDAGMYLDTTPLVKGHLTDKGKVVIKNTKDVIRQEVRLNAIHKWAEHKKEARFIQVRVEKSYWDYASQIVDPDRIHSVEDKGTHYVITEKVNVLISNYNYEVEISTPRENGGRSAMTLQQHCFITVADKALGEAIAKLSANRRNTARDLVMMMSSLSNIEVLQSQPYVLAKMDHAGRARLAQLLGDTIYQSDRKLFGALQKRLTKDGIEKFLLLSYTFTDGAGNVRDIKVPLKMSVIMESIGFISGNADGFGNLLATTLRYAATAGDESGSESRMNSMMVALAQGLRSWMNSLVDSKSIYKRVSMTAKITVLGKIRTSYDPNLHSTDGVPVVILHPKCDVTRELLKDENGQYMAKYLEFPHCYLSDKVKCEANPGFFRGTAFCSVDAEDKDTYTSRPVVSRLEGDIVGLTRVPMPMLSAFRVKLDNKVGHVGHAITLPHLWAFNNEGDADGDGVSMINLDQFGYDTERAIALNDSLMSFKGYWTVYGLDPKDHPFADFCEVPGKKKIDYKWTNVFWLEEEYRNTCKKVRSHYLGPVAISYGISSMSVFDLVEYSYKQDHNKVELVHRMAATTFAWRALYEGLGLAGWSDGAKEFFDVLRSITYGYYFNGQNLNNIVVGIDKKGNWTNRSKDIVINRIEDPVGHLIKLSGLNYQHETRSAEQIEKSKRLIIEIVVRNSLYLESFRALTSGNGFKKHVLKSPMLARTSAIYGALRQATQGSDPGGVAQIDNDQFIDIEEAPMSLHMANLEGNLYSTMNCSWLAKVLRNASETLANLTMYKKQLADLEMYNQ